MPSNRYKKTHISFRKKSKNLMTKTLKNKRKKQKKVGGNPFSKPLFGGEILNALKNSQKITVKLKPKQKGLFSKAPLFSGSIELARKNSNNIVKKLKPSMLSNIKTKLKSTSQNNVESEPEQEYTKFFAGNILTAAQNAQNIFKKINGVSQSDPQKVENKFKKAIRNMKKHTGDLMRGLKSAMTKGTSEDEVDDRIKCPKGEPKTLTLTFGNLPITDVRENLSSSVEEKIFEFQKQD